MSSDELIAAARGAESARRGSVSASMAKVARGDVSTADVKPDSSDSGDWQMTPGPVEPDEPVEVWTSTRRTSTPRRNRGGSTIPPERVAGRRFRGRRLVGLVVAGFVLFSIVSPNFGRLSTFIQDQFDGGDTALPAAVQPVDAEIVNLALHRPVTASGEFQSEATSVVDGDRTTSWNAGGFAPQWVLVNLGSVSTIHTVRLLIGQSPDGATTHRLVGWGPDVEEQILHEFDGDTVDRRWLSVTFDEPIPGIQDVGVLTVRSPSWVAWYEIEIEGWRNESSGTADAASAKTTKNASTSPITR